MESACFFIASLYFVKKMNQTSDKIKFRSGMPEPNRNCSDQDLMTRFKNSCTSLSNDPMLSR
jgi:hypothetical protein